MCWQVISDETHTYTHTGCINALLGLKFQRAGSLTSQGLSRCPLIARTSALCSLTGTRSTKCMFIRVHVPVWERAVLPLMPQPQPYAHAKVLRAHMMDMCVYVLCTFSVGQWDLPLQLQSPARHVCTCMSKVKKLCS
jgi:hypothetical protein